MKVNLEGRSSLCGGFQKQLCDSSDQRAVEEILVEWLCGQEPLKMEEQLTRLGRRRRVRGMLLYYCSPHPQKVGTSPYHSVPNFRYDSGA
jgi:hypothetical protein